MLLEMQRIFYEDLRVEETRKEQEGSSTSWEDEEDDFLARAVYDHMNLNAEQRWASLPEKLPPLDDAEVDDRVPRFVVLHGSCLYLYMLSTDLSPQDSTMLSDIVEVGPLPCLRGCCSWRWCIFISFRLCNCHTTIIIASLQ